MIGPARGKIGAIDAAYAALVLLALLPAFLMRYPASADYLNHLARLYVLSAPDGDPVHQFYRPAWHLMPNLGFDLPGYVLAAVLPVETAAKTVWLAAVMGLAGATWVLGRTLHGRTEPTLLLAAPCLLCLPVTAGFIGFTLGLASALAVVALWFRMGGRPSLATLSMLNATAAAILVMHEAAAGALIFTVAAICALQAPWRLSQIVMRGLGVLPGFILPAALLPFMESVPPAGGHGPVFTLLGKLDLLSRVVFTGNFAADLTGTVALLLALYLVLRRPGGFCDRRLVPALLAWAGLLLVMPREIGRATAIDMRLAVFPALLLIAGLSAGKIPQARLRLIGLFVLGAVAARSAILIPVWRDYNLAVEGFRSMALAVPPGAKVIVAESDTGGCGTGGRWAPFFEHIPSLLLIERGAFVPTIFSGQGMQPIRPTASVRQIMDPDVPALPLWALAKADQPAAREKLAADVRLGAWQPYFLDWRRDYDYLAVLDAGCGPRARLDDGLTQIGESSAYRLFKIGHI